MWLNASNDWVYPHLHIAAERMIYLANTHPNAQGTLLRYLNQAARELLLAQSSDWAFLMTVGTARQYSEKRTRDHIDRFLELFHRVQENRLDEGFVGHLESIDNLFPAIDYRAYQSINS